MPREFSGGGSVYVCANKWATFRIAVILTVAFAQLSNIAAGQSIYGAIIGTVRDPSGAVVSGANVEVVNQGTGVAARRVTDVDGDFRLVNLDPGTYTVTVSIGGFSTQKHQNLSLQARETVRSDFQLQVAGTSTEVEVIERQGVVSEVPTQSSSLSGTDINSLALNFRATNNTSPLQVAVLSPGVQTDQAGNVSISGGLPNATSFSIDGVSTTQVRASGPNSDLFPSVETIAEFRVNTSGASAEYSQPTDLTIVTKSGTNEFHGSAFWFFQRDALNARDAFAATRQKE